MILNKLNWVLGKSSAAVLILWVAPGALLAACPPYELIGEGELPATLLRETSGIVASRTTNGIYWAHNDSGNDARLFAVTATGTLRANLQVTGSENIDWEDITAGPGAVYIADTGDNDLERTEVAVLRFNEPTISLSGNVVTGNLSTSQRYRLQYPGGAKYDSETLMYKSDTDEFFLVTRDRSDEGKCHVFKKSPPHVNGSLSTLQFVYTIPLTGSLNIKGGDISQDGRRCILLLHSNNTEATNAWAWDNTFFSGTRCVYTVQSFQQAEALCFDTLGTSFFVTSEGNRAPLLRYSLPYPTMSRWTFE